VLECVSQDCGLDNEIEIDGTNNIVRFRLGYVLYRKHGAMLFPHFLMTEDGEEELYAHVDCAIDAGLKPEKLTAHTCYYNNRQFYCEGDPEETCLLIEIGALNGEDEFIASQRGAIHWACAHRWWAPELFEELEGTTTTIEEAENA
jgi:hypothetical protein